MADAPAAPEWSFDLHQLSRKDYNAFRRGLLTDEQDNALLAKVTGMTADMIDALPLDEYKRLLAAFFKKAREPLADPNSPAPSGTP